MNKAISEGRGGASSCVVPLLRRRTARYTATVRVFITGVGVVSSIGLGKGAFFDALASGTSGISPVEAFDVTNLGRELAGEAKGFRPKDHLTALEARRMGRCSQMALAAARMAIKDSGSSRQTRGKMQAGWLPEHPEGVPAAFA